MKRRRFEILLVACWVVLAAYTFQEAQYPGFEPISRWQYPWASAAMTSAGLALLLLAFYTITRISHRQWRVAAVTIYVVVLLFLVWTSFITDQRGHFYVPGQVAAVILVILAGRGIAKVAKGKRLAA